MLNSTCSICENDDKNSQLDVKYTIRDLSFKIDLFLSNQILELLSQISYIRLQVAMDNERLTNFRLHIQPDDHFRRQIVLLGSDIPEHMVANGTTCTSDSSTFLQVIIIDHMCINPIYVVPLVAIIA